MDRLDPDGAAALARACVPGQVLPDAVVAFLVDRSEGLPLLVEELLAGLLESPSLVYDDGGWSVVGGLSAGVSHTLVDLVRRRLAHVAAALRPVLDAAAVIGGEVDWTLLESVTGLPVPTVAAGLRAAVSAHLLEAGDDTAGGLRWRHMAIRDAVLAELLPPEVATYALRAAEMLEQRDPQLAGPDGLLARSCTRAAASPSERPKCCWRSAAGLQPRSTQHRRRPPEALRGAQRRGFGVSPGSWDDRDHRAGVWLR